MNTKVRRRQRSKGMSDKHERLEHERVEVDREDLLAEATALVERIELAVDGLGEPVVVGFRRQGAASVYFGADPAYQFNVRGELRRAYADGLLYKAERGRLVAMSRRRTDTAVELVRRDLDDGGQRAFGERLADQLRQLRDALETSRFRVGGQVSSGGDVLARVRTWLAELALPPVVADRPNVQ
jgi:hypothetical protein